MLERQTSRDDLERFVEAQSGVYERVVAELRAARKTSHWMWFIFPQIAGLGSSPTARLYAISGRREAEAYLVHAVLGVRLRECTRLVNASPASRTLSEIFGYPDDLKFCSSMTLFGFVAPEEPVFEQALKRFCGGEPDRATLERLK